MGSDRSGFGKDDGRCQNSSNGVATSLMGAIGDVSGGRWGRPPSATQARRRSVGHRPNSERVSAPWRAGSSETRVSPARQEYNEALEAGLVHFANGRMQLAAASFAQCATLWPQDHTPPYNLASLRLNSR